MQTLSIKIGSRASRLALAMANEVRNLLLTCHNLPQQAIKIIPITTSGDRLVDRSLAEIGGKGLFTLEIEEALTNGTIDIAVHSAKDMPTILPDHLHLSAFLKREDPRDGFIGRDVKCLLDLPHGATVGSAALRRQALIKKIRPDLQVVLFRGNVDTRLKKLQAGEVDATFLAMAGVNRLDMAEVISDIMDPKTFIPAPGQGALALETRLGDTKIDQLVAKIADDETMIELKCERMFLKYLDGSCRTPLGGYARLDGETLYFSGIILSPDGSVSYDIELQGHRSEAEAMGQMAAEKLRRDAGNDFFKDWT